MQQRKPAPSGTPPMRRSVPGVDHEASLPPESVGPRPGTKLKQYVKVRVDYHLDGRIIPLKFRTEDGPVVVIDQILDIRQAAALRAGGSGIRYTCRVGERLLFLFHDRNWWFVEG